MMNDPLVKAALFPVGAGSGRMRIGNVDVDLVRNELNDDIEIRGRIVVRGVRHVTGRDAHEPGRQQNELAELCNSLEACAP